MVQKIFLIFFVVLLLPSNCWADSNWGTLIWSQDNWYSSIPVPNGGDANGDAIPDNSQNNVISFLSEVTTDYVVVDSATVGAGAEVINVSVKDEAYYSDDPDYDMPHGVVKFDVIGLPIGGSETIRVYYWGVNDLNGYEYRKFDQFSGTWYWLPGVTFGSVVIGSETVAYADLYLVDGSIGDGDNTADGRIKDPGGPALPSGPVCTSDPASIGEHTYVTIRSAYDAIASSGIIEIQGGETVESLVFDRDVNVILKGGYDCYFNEPPTGQSTINALGSALIIRNGTVIFENIILL